MCKLPKNEEWGYRILDWWLCLSTCNCFLGFIDERLQIVLDWRYPKQRFGGRSVVSRSSEKRLSRSFNKSIVFYHNATFQGEKIWTEEITDNISRRSFLLQRRPEKTFLNMFFLTPRTFVFLSCPTVELLERRDMRWTGALNRLLFNARWDRTCTVCLVQR